MGNYRMVDGIPDGNNTPEPEIPWNLQVRCDYCQGLFVTTRPKMEEMFKLKIRICPACEAKMPSKLDTIRLQIQAEDQKPERPMFQEKHTFDYVSSKIKAFERKMQEWHKKYWPKLGEKIYEI